MEATQIISANEMEAAPMGSEFDDNEKVFSPRGSNWRNPSLDLRGHLYTMLENSILSDMTFLVGEGKDSVPAHRFVLVLWSKVFEEMPDTVEIPEMNVAALKAFLKFLYTEEFDVTAEDLMPVLCAAKRFEVPLLASKCVAVLKSEIKDSTAVSMYQAAKLLNEDVLAEESLSYILKNATTIIHEEDFLLLTQENLEYLLERDDLEVDEVELFHAICRWSVKECEKQEIEGTTDNQRNVLKGAMRQIRFPIMSSKDFALHVAPTELLNDKEMISLLIQFSVPAIERINIPTLAHGFCDRERKGGQPPKKRMKPGKPFADTKDAIITLDDDMAKENGDPTGALVNIEWRKPHAGLKFNLLTMFETGALHDITFIVGEEKVKVHAHKFILCVWSSVFESMFYGHLKDVTEHPVEICNFSPSGFKSFLKVLYTENFDVSVENVMNVFFIAKTYDVGFLGDKCVALLKTSVADNTAVSIYQAAKVLEDEKLAEIAWSYVLRRGFAVMKESDFLNISHQNLCIVLESNDLNCPETEVFEALLRWGRNECEKQQIPKTPENLRLVLKTALQLIRFPLMSVKDFSLQVAPTELLSDKELVGILIYFNLPPSERENAYRLAFSCKERKIRTLLVKERVSFCNLSMSCDRSVVVKGFSFSGMDANKIGYAPTSLFVYNSKKGMSYATSYTDTMVSEEGKDRFTLTFKMPISIKAGEWYICSEMTMQGRQGPSKIERETWVTVKNRQGDVNFQFQVQPIKDNEGVFEYAVPEVIFSNT